jgi:hypothetical protein
MDRWGERRMCCGVRMEEVLIFPEREGLVGLGVKEGAERESWEATFEGYVEASEEDGLGLRRRLGRAWFWFREKGGGPAGGGKMRGRRAV